MKPKFVIATPHQGRPIPCDWHIAMQMLQLPTNTTHVRLWRKGLGTDEAQNQMVEDALNLGAEYILFIDDDTQPPPSVILDLMRVLETYDSSVMACGGIYTTKTVPPEPIVYMERHGGAFWNWKMGDIFQCWALGNGCLMVRMSVFKMMPKPYFRVINSVEQLAEHADIFPEVMEQKPMHVDISTDIFLAARLEQLGFKTMAHGGVLPIHWGIDGKPYWLPRGIGPTANVTFDGKPFGWVNPDLAMKVTA